MTSSEVSDPESSDEAGTASATEGSRDRVPTQDYVEWLESRSMLHQAHRLSDEVSGKSLQWRHAFGRPRPTDVIKTASVWFTSYPKSIITPPGASVLATLGSDELLSTLADIGVEGVHMGPMKRAGGLTGRSYTPSIDGFFDRIELTIDPLFGTDDEYIELTKSAKDFDLAVMGDLVPAHTGKGPDFRLAEVAHKNYAGLYTMVEISEGDWDLLDAVPDGSDSVNLDPDVVQQLEDKGYIPGPLEVIPFFDPDVKESNWSATDVVVGVDGQRRRWVYLHVFKEGQPSLNWLDPSFGAQRVILADVVQSLLMLGVTGLRLDANPLLGVERRPGIDKSWVEGHPLAEGGSNTIAMMVRKLGGFTFQELNVALEDLSRFSTWGADLSYDFVTRPAYLYAMATGDSGPLRLVLELIKQAGLDGPTFVHALQNHDELMFDLSHLRKHGDDTFVVNGKAVLGRVLYDGMYERAKERVLGTGTDCMTEFSNLGFCGTLTSLAAAACDVPDPYRMNGEERAEVLRLHLLAAVFNAMQPGVFALSGWDLVGALPVQPHELGSWLDDDDYRWINRGAFDLMGVDADATASDVGLPKAKALYGTLPEQLSEPSSFVSQLRRMLRARKDSSIAFSRIAAVPDVDDPGLVVLVLRRPDDQGWAISMLNFGRQTVDETVRVRDLGGLRARLIYSTLDDDPKTVEISRKGRLPVALAPLQAQVYVAH